MIKKIWITAIDPSFITDNGTGKSRMKNLSDYLAAKGYEVTVFTSAFDHRKKYWAYKTTTILHPAKNFRLVAIKSSVAYKTNTSPTRVIYHVLLGNKMHKIIKQTDKFPVPDLIFCSWPPEEFCSVMLDYGKKHNVPVILDVRDLWPDIFERALPGTVRKFSKIALMPMKCKAKKSFRRSSAICATSEPCLEFGLNYAKRERRDNDRIIFIGGKKTVLGKDVMERRVHEWEMEGVTEDTWNICFFSSLSKTAIDFDTVIDALKKVHEYHHEIRLVVGGVGDDYERLLEKTKDISYIKMMGWLNLEQMSSLMSISKLGLLCYRNTPDFKNGWGNKIGQYLSAKLPYFTSAEGMAKTYLEKYGCGLYYNEGDPDDFARVLLSYMEEPEKQIEFRENAYARYKADFDSTVVLGKFEQMIQDVYRSYHSIDKGC